MVSKRYLFFTIMVFWLGFWGCLQGSLRAEVKDPLLKVLVRKGLLTEQEALEIKKEAELEAKKEKERIASEVKTRIEAEGEKIPKGLKGVKLGTLTYLDYSSGYGPFSQDGSKDSTNYFSVTRAYFNFEKKITPWFSFRFTPDIHSGNGDDYDLKIKYAYAKFKLPSVGPFTGLFIEAGQGHFPWLDFQEHINPYRMQGPMPREFFGTFNSADRGISLAGNIGGKLDSHFIEKLSAHYPTFDHYVGKYGTFWLSVMNGAGYHSKEVNQNKGVEGRITLRPFGNSTTGMLPLAGLQASYLFIIGEGNDENSLGGSAPDYLVNLFMLSYQHPWFVLTAEYSTSRGNNSGSWVVTRADGHIEELDTVCYSVFGDVTLPIFSEKLHVTGRFDWFDPDKEGVNDIARHYMMGLAYYLTGKNIILLNAEWMDYDRNFRIKPTLDFGKWGKYNPNGVGDLEDGFRIQTTFQVSF